MLKRFLFIIFLFLRYTITRLRLDNYFNYVTDRSFYKLFLNVFVSNTVTLCSPSSDPRSSSNAQSWNGNNAPNQSRSFRVLQQITDTLDEAEAEKNAKEQSNNQSDQADGAKQQYGRSTAQQQDAAEGQLRRLQLSNEDKALMNRVKNQGKYSCGSTRVPRCRRC